MEQQDFGDNMENGLIGNRGGIVFTKATQTSAGSSSANAVYTLPNHVFKFLGAAGLIVVNIATLASSVLGITISVNNSTMPLTDGAGSALTGITVGDHILAFNKVDDTLKLLL